MIALCNANSIHIPLKDKSVQCIITSPPYWALRSYLDNGHKHKNLEIGMEPTPAAYVASIVAVARECWRVLRDDGVMWLNLGDSYAGGGGYYPDAPSNKNGGSISSRQDNNSGAKTKGIRSIDGLKPKDLCGIPWRVAFALQEAGWYLRSDIIWSKPNPMPESVTDRPTKAHEYIFLLTKRARYYYDAEAIKETSNVGYKSSDFLPVSEKDKQESTKRTAATGASMNNRNNEYNGQRNKRSVWEIATQPYSGAHYATFPLDLVRPMVLAGTSPCACEVCGAPWERVTKSVFVPQPDVSAEKVDYRGKTLGKFEGWPRGTNRVSTVGWRSTCCHTNSGAAHCVVLDPFCGSGTVGEVCRESGRDFIGLDLSLKYLTDNAMPRALNTNTAGSMAALPLFAELEIDDAA